MDKSTTGALGGGIKGGATGAAVGSAIAPGIGTAIGAGTGAIGGGILGYEQGSAQEDADKQLQNEMADIAKRYEEYRPQVAAARMAALNQAFSFFAPYNIALGNIYGPQAQMPMAPPPGGGVAHPGQPVPQATSFAPLANPFGSAGSPSPSPTGRVGQAGRARPQSRPSMAPPPAGPPTNTDGEKPLMQPRGGYVPGGPPANENAPYLPYKTGPV